MRLGVQDRTSFPASRQLTVLIRGYRPVTTVGFLFGVVLTGCQDGPPRLGATFFDSLPATPVSSTGELRLEREPLAKIGSPGGAGPPLFLVWDAAFLPNGDLAVITDGTRSILVFDSAGTLVREIGREGDGPGEFSAPRIITEASETRIEVWDYGHRRVVRFDAAGSPSTMTVAGPRSPWYPHRVHRMGARGFIVASLLGAERRKRRGLNSDSTFITLVDSLGKEHRVVGMFPRFDEFRGDAGSFPVPSARGELDLAGTTEAFYVGDGLQAIIIEFDVNGDATRRLLLPVERKAMSPALRAARRKALIDRYEHPRAKRRLAAAFDEAGPLLDSLAVYQDFVAASDGRLWVGLYEVGAPPRHWLVVDLVETTALRVALEEGADVLDATEDRIALLLKDELDRERIEVYRFATDGGG